LPFSFSRIWPFWNCLWPNLALLIFLDLATLLPPPYHHPGVSCIIWTVSYSFILILNSLPYPKHNLILTPLRGKIIWFLNKTLINSFSYGATSAHLSWEDWSWTFLNLSSSFNTNNLQFQRIKIIFSLGQQELFSFEWKMETRTHIERERESVCMCVCVCVWTTYKYKTGSRSNFLIVMEESKRNIFSYSIIKLFVLIRQIY